MERREGLGGVLDRHAEQEPAGGLRVAEQSVRNRVAAAERRRRERSLGGEGAPHAAREESARAGERGKCCGGEARAEPAGGEHLAQVAGEAEARDVRARPREAPRDLRGGAVGAEHRALRGREPRAPREAARVRREDDAGAERLRQQEHVAPGEPALWKRRSARRQIAQHREAHRELGAERAVSPHEGDRERVELAADAGQRLGERFLRAALGHGHPGERVARRAALRVDVRDRIQRRHPTYEPWVVGEGAKAVDGGEQDVAARRAQGRRVVGLREPEQHARIGRGGRERAQRGREAGRGDLRGAAAAAHRGVRGHGGELGCGRAVATQHAEAAHKGAVDVILEAPHARAGESGAPLPAERTPSAEIQEGQEVPLRPVVAQVATRELRAQVRVEDRPLADRVDARLGNPRRALEARAVADREERLVSHHLQRVAHAHEAGRILRERARREQRVRGRAGREDREVARERSARRQGELRPARAPRPALPGGAPRRAA